MPMGPRGYLMMTILSLLGEYGAMSPQEMHKRIGAANPTIHDSLHRLLKLGDITRERRVRRTHKYGLSPFVYSLVKK